MPRESGRTDWRYNVFARAWKIGKSTFLFDYGMN